MIISENNSTNNIIEDDINIDINDIKNKNNANFKSSDGELLIKNSDNNNSNNHVKQRSTVPIPHISSNQREQIAPNYSKKLLVDCYKPAILGTAYHNRYIITKGKQKSYIDISI